MQQHISAIPNNLGEIEEEISIATLKPSLLQTWPNWLFGFAALLAAHIVIRQGFGSLDALAQDLFQWFPFLPSPPALAWWLLLAILCGALWYPGLLTWQLAVTSYEITTRRILYVWGILNRHHDQIEVARVRDIRVSRPLSLRLIRQGNVHLLTVDRQHGHLAITGLQAPLALKNAIHQLNVAERQRQGYRELESTQYLGC